MKYELVKNVISLLEDFEAENLQHKLYEGSVEDFKNWIIETTSKPSQAKEPNWEGKENGRSPESVISTFIVHMNRYAKSYSKSAILGSDFSSQEDFIYLINLKAFGSMSKMELIRKNVHEKPVGMQIINRLLKQGWINQINSETDKRSKVIGITAKGLETLEQQFFKIRQASQIVTGNLTYHEKMDLIRLLTKLNDFHQAVYDKNIICENLLEEALKGKILAN